jgi:hypothetical protein
MKIAGHRSTGYRKMQSRRGFMIVTCVRRAERTSERRLPGGLRILTPSLVSALHCRSSNRYNIAIGHKLLE